PRPRPPRGPIWLSLPSRPSPARAPPAGGTSAPAASRLLPPPHAPAPFRLSSMERSNDTGNEPSFPATSRPPPGDRQLRLVHARVGQGEPTRTEHTRRGHRRKRRGPQP